MSAAKEDVMRERGDAAADTPFARTNRGPEAVSLEMPEGRHSLVGTLMQKFLAALDNPPVGFVLPGGEAIGTARANLVARLHFRDRASALRFIADPYLHFGDAYSDGRIEVAGDLVRFVEVVNRIRPTTRAQRAMQRAMQWLHRPGRNTQRGSRDNIHRHYDMGNDFYSLWLGETMAYSCAYYPTPDAELEVAQRAKMDHVCRKLRLRPGERVVEAGCGWGGLAIHMARRYGVKVRSYNISREQIAYARAWAERESLAGKVEFVEDDYRNIRGDYDAFVSIGMLEHVGVENYRQLGGVARRSMGSNSRGLIHSIGRDWPKPLNAWIEKRIFPGAMPPSLRQMMDIFEPWELSILDVENIRLHYSRTLMHWLELYERNVAQVRAMFDEKFVRAWRLYLCGSIAAFNTGDLQLFQVVFAPHGSNHVPWTRAYLYQS